MRSWGFGERIIAVAVLPAAFIAACLAAYFLLLRQEDAEQAFVHHGQSLARLFAPATEYGIFTGNAEELRRLAQALAETVEETSAVVIHDSTGLPLMSIGTPRARHSAKQLPDGWTGLDPTGAVQFFHVKVWRTPPLFSDPLLGGPPSLNPGPIGSVTLEMSRAGMLAAKREMILVGLLATLAALLLGLLLALRLAASVSRPVLALQRVVAAIRAGDLTARVASQPDSTLRGLEEGVNEMAAALQAGRDELERRIAAATAELKQKRDEAEQASVAKSRFLAAASHDLRQPLHALALFAEQLLQAETRPPQQHLLRQVVTAVTSMEELLGSLLDVSRADLGTLQPVIRPLALHALLERVVAAHLGSARAKGLRLRLHPTRHWCLSDATLLYRIVSNLVANAITYSEHGGVLIGVRPAGERLRIEVRDSGIGIAPEYHGLIFKEFFQIGNPERDAKKGLGLGLALVERLARLLDHPLSLRSAPGRGSVFAITVPRHAPVETTAGAASRPRLLLLGEAAADTALRALVADWGCEILTAWPAAAAPDLVICDEAALPALRSRAGSSAAGQRLPVIVLGNIPANLSGMAGLDPVALPKPPQPAKLRALISHLLDDPDVHATT